MVKAHRDKLFRALDMIAEDKTTREIAKEMELSFTQLKEIKEVLPLYVEIKELEKKLLELKDEYVASKVVKNLKKRVDELRREEELESEINRLRRRKELLEEETSEGIKAKLLWAKSIIKSLLSDLARFRRWLIQEELPAIMMIDIAREVTG